MDKRPVFEWEGHKVKPSIADRMIIFVIWIATLTIIVGMGVLINKKLQKKDTRRNLIVSASVANDNNKNSKQVVQKNIKKKPAVNTKEVIAVAEKPLISTKEIKESKTIKSKEEKGPFSLRLNTKFKDFESANTKALEFELMNFKTVIVPVKNSYFIELEKLDSLEDANSLRNTLTSSNIKAKIVKSSQKFLLPQKKLKEEIQKISMLSDSQKKSQEVVTTKNIITKKPQTIENKSETKPVEKKVTTSEIISPKKPHKIENKSETKPIEKKIQSSKVIASKKPQIKKEEIKTSPITKNKKAIKTITKKPDYLKQVEEKAAKVENKELMTINEPKGIYYSLQAGAYSERFGADRLAAFLRNNSELPVFVKKINGLYKVYSGTFRNPDIAKKYLNSLSFPKFDNENISFFIAKIKN